MRHSEVTDIWPSNDNPVDDRQVEMFGVGPMVVGVDRATGRNVRVIGKVVDGLLIIHEILEMGDGPVAACP